MRLDHVKGMSVETVLRQKYPMLSDDMLELMMESRRTIDFFTNLDVEDDEAYLVARYAVPRVVETLQRGDTRAAYEEVQRAIDSYMY